MADFLTVGFGLRGAAFTLRPIHTDSLFMNSTLALNKTYEQTLSNSRKSDINITLIYVIFFPGILGILSAAHLSRCSRAAASGQLSSALILQSPQELTLAVWTTAH